MTARKYLCPACKAKAGVRIAYGYPSSELFEMASRGEVALGGCVIDIDEEQPNRKCTQCGFEWSAGKAGNPTVAA